MRFSSLAKTRILPLLVMILTIVSAFLVAVVSRGLPSHASGPAISTFQGTHGIIKRAATSQFPSHRTSTDPSPPRLSPSHLDHGGVTTVSGLGSHAPHATDPGMDMDESQLLHNFHGLHSVDSFRVNGFVQEPPDQGLCVGTLLRSTVVGEIINSVVAFYTPNGSLFGPQENLNVFFAEPVTEEMIDPRCVFDLTTNTWFFTSLALAPTTTLLPNHVDILALHLNLSASIFRVDVTFPHNTAGRCPCQGDQPKLGIDEQNVYITVDQFNAAETLETGDTLIALSKSQLVAGASVVNIAEFHNLSLAGIGVTALQPAITYDDSNIEYLLNSFPFANEAQTIPNTISHLLGLWAISDTQAVTAGGVPKLSATTINSEIYGFPVPALTTNGLSLATFTNDSRMQQVQFINGQLWGALDSAVAVDRDPVTRDGAAWFEIQPRVESNGKVTGAQFTNQGYVAVKGKYLVYPAIETTFGGTTGISFSITSPTLNPSTGYVIRKSGSENFGRAHLTALGSGPDIGFTCALGFPLQCRWGDYSWTALDPNGQDLWMAAEDIVPHVATHISQGKPFKTNWGTQVWAVMGDH
jgi:hypothetical protein